MSLIGRLRELPLERRKKMALWLSVGFTAFIFFGWLLLPAEDSMPSDEPTSAALTEVGRAIDEQFTRLKAGWDDALKRAEELEKETASTSSSSEGTATTTEVFSGTGGATTSEIEP